jgi:hypothetical protein
MGFDLDYSERVTLDAEELAGGGTRAAYEDLLPAPRKYHFTDSKLESGRAQL